MENEKELKGDLDTTYILMRLVLDTYYDDLAKIKDSSIEKTTEVGNKGTVYLKDGRSFTITVEEIK